MIITKEKFEDGIYEIHVHSKKLDNSAFAFWKDILDTSRTLNAAGLMYVSDAEHVISKRGAMQLVNMIAESSLTALAYVRLVIPNPDEVEALTVISNYSRNVGVHMQTFYSRDEGHSWLKEKLEQES